MRLATLTTKTKTIKKPQLKKAGAFDKSTTAQMQRKSTLIFLDQFLLLEKKKYTSFKSLLSN